MGRAVRGECESARGADDGSSLDRCGGGAEIGGGEEPTPTSSTDTETGSYGSVVKRALHHGRATIRSRQGCRAGKETWREILTYPSGPPCGESRGGERGTRGGDAVTIYVGSVWHRDHAGPVAIESDVCKPAREGRESVPGLGL